MSNAGSEYFLRTSLLRFDFGTEGVSCAGCPKRLKLGLWRRVVALLRREGGETTGVERGELIAGDDLEDTCVTAA